MIFKITRQDVNSRPSLKGNCGKWCIESNGSYFIKSTKKEIIELRNYLKQN